MASKRAGELSRILSEGQTVGLDLGGDEFINDNALHTPPSGYHYYKVVPKEATVFAVLTDSLRVNGSNSPLDPESHPSGVAITGHITAIDLTSGACWAYLAPS